MKVLELLPMIKANRYTYLNLDRSTVDIFKEMYSYLRRNKNKTVPASCKKQIETILSEDDNEHLNKYAAMLRINRMMIN